MKKPVSKIGVKVNVKDKNNFILNNALIIDLTTIREEQYIALKWALSFLENIGIQLLISEENYNKLKNRFTKPNGQI